MLRLARFAASASSSVAIAIAIAATAVACGGRPRLLDGPLEPAKPVSIELTTAAQLVGKGFISTEHTEVRMTIDPTGTIALWGSTNRPGAPGSYDLWMARRTKPGAPWSEALPVPFNTPAKEFDPAFSPDGRELYFFSDRPGGRGGDDIYRVSFDGNTFGPVEALGPEINSPGNEWAPALSPDNSTLLFASNGRGGAGRQDLFFAERAGAGFLPARAVPGMVNTAEDELDATFLYDGRSLVFARSANIDDQPVILTFSSPIDGAYPKGSALPLSVNVEGANSFGPAISWEARDVLTFNSKRPEDAAGGQDLYEIHYKLNAAP